MQRLAGPGARFAANGKDRPGLGVLRSDMDHFCLTAAPPQAPYASSRDDVFALESCTTSRDVVDLIHAWYAHYNRGDGEPSLDYWHEDAEYHTAPDDPDSARHLGIDAIGRLFASWREAYPDLRVEVHEAKANRNRVFAWICFVGRGAASGISMQMELAHVYTVHGGKTARVVEYTDRTAALQAVGLGGQQDSSGHSHSAGTSMRNRVE